MPAALIKLELDENGVLQGVQSLNKSFDMLGSSGKKAGSAASSGMKEMDSSTKKARESAELLTRVTGIELPRAIRNVIAESQVGGSIIAGLFNAAVIATAIDAVANYAGKIKSASEALMGYTEASQKFWEDSKTANAKAMSTFTDPKVGQNIVRTLASAKNEAENTADTFRSLGKTQLAAFDTGGIAGYLYYLYKANKATDEAVKSTEILLDATENQGKVTVSTNLAVAAAQAQAKEAGLKGLAAINQQELDQEKQLDLQKVQLGSTYDSLKTANAQKASNDRKALMREELTAAADLQSQVLAIGASQVEQIRIKAERDIQKLMEQSQRHEISPAFYSSETISISEQAFKQTEELKKQITIQGNAAILQSNSSAAKGTVQIELDLQAKLQSILDEETRVGVAMPLQRLAAEKDAANKIAQIRREEEQKVTQAETDAETAMLEAIVPQWERGYVQVAAAHKAALVQIEKDNADHLLTDDQYRRLEIAENTKFEAQMADQHKQTLEQMSSEFESFFDDMFNGNMSKRILGNAKKMFAQLVALWAQSTGAFQGGGLLSSLLFGPNTQLGGNPFGGGGMTVPGGNGFGLNNGGAIGGGWGGGIAGSTGLLGGGSGSSSSGSTSALDFLGGGGATASAFNSVGASTNPNGIAPFVSNPPRAQVNADGTVSLVPGGGSSTGRGGFGAGGIFSTISRGVGGVGGLLSTVGMLGAGAIGNKFGGMPGAIGGSLAALGVAGSLGSTPALSLIQALGGVSVLAPVAGAALGFGVGENYGKLAGGITGAATGAGLMALFASSLAIGPVGIIIAGIIGLLGGIFGGLYGSSKRKKAAESYATQVLPGIKGVVDQYEQFQIDYSTASGDLDSIQKTASDELGKLKGEGRKVFDRQVKPAIDSARNTIGSDQRERDRREKLAFSAPMFHSGGYVDSPSGMSGFRMGNGELIAILKRGEFVANEPATRQNRAALEQMNRGGTLAVSGGMPSIVIQALDSKSVHQWLRSGGGIAAIRDAWYAANSEGRS